MALSDEDVQKQIKNMISFIEQEAREKVNEINEKAAEEFEIEKSRLVQEQRSKMKEFFAKEEKKLEQRKKIQHSNTVNQARLRILGCQQEHLRSVVEHARQKLLGLAQDSAAYRNTVRGLITQGLFQLLEKRVIVVCRRKDAPLVAEVVKECASEYERATGNQIDVQVDRDNFLPEDIAGGVELTVPGARVRVVNTLESRLELLSRQMAPELRQILFGPNKNRKFID